MYTCAYNCKKSVIFVLIIKNHLNKQIYILDINFLILSIIVFFRFMSIKLFSIVK